VYQRLRALPGGGGAAERRDREDAERLQRRWAKPLVADEDVDVRRRGYAYRARDAGGVVRETLELLTTRRSGAMGAVAAVQRLARRGLERRVRSSTSGAWPDEPAVLTWAAGPLRAPGYRGAPPLLEPGHAAGQTA